jgi:hypothetical protein
MTTLLLQSLLCAPLIAPVAMATDPPVSSDHRFSVLGMQICVGEPDSQPCDIRLPASKQSVEPEAERAEPKPVQMTLFGKTLCIGDVPDRTMCDLHLEGAVTEQNSADA